MNINIVVALTEGSRVIGKDGGIPWYIPADLKHFQRLTVGHPVIMGRKTFDSIGKPLPGRTNIVLSHSLPSESHGVIVTRALNEALFRARISEGGHEIFIIGGENIFREALEKVDRLYLTKIKAEFEGDTFFPPYEHLFPRIVSSKTQTIDGYTLSFETLER